MPPDEPGGAQRSVLVGREYELGLLRAALDGALTRRTQLVEIVGDAGMGKSRLVAELPGLAPQFFFHAATCDRTRSSEPYVPVRSLLRTVAGIPEVADPADAGRRLRACLEVVAPELSPVAWLLEGPFGADAGAAGSGQGDPARRTELMYGAVDALLSRTLTMPAILLFEDAHWMDDSSRSLLSHIVRSGVQKPWLVCVTRRPEGQTLAEGASKVVLVLAPLSHDDAATVARSSAGTGLHPADLERIVERSGGNPFFINELVEAGGASGSALPSSVENVVSGRLASLTAAERFVLGHAAVLGRSFELELLREVMPETDVELDLPPLASFVHEVALDRFEFRHDLIQEAAYRLLAPEDRRRAHRRLAEAIEGGADSGVGDVTAALAFHFRHAELWERAWQYGVLAGRAAMGRYANEVAAQSFELALDALEASDLDVPQGVIVDVRESLADVHALAGRYERAEAEFETLGRMVAGSAAEARILRKRSECMIARGDYEDATSLLEQALDSGDEEQVETLLDLAGAAFRQGRFDRSLECADHAIALLEATQDDRRLRARAYYVRETAADFLYGPGTDALRLEALAIFEELGDVEGVIRTANNLGVHAQFTGRWADALRYYRTAAGLASQIGSLHDAPTIGNNVGEILSDQGRLDEAVRQFEESHELCAAADSAFGLGVTKRNLGRIAVRRGQAAEGESLLVAAIDELQAIGSDQFALEAEAYLAEGYIFAGRQLEADERAVAVQANENVDRTPGLAALLERVRGYSAFQRFEPDVAADHFRRSVELAERDRAEFELALTLIAQAELAERTSLDDPSSLRDKAQAIFDRLGVIAVPEVPLPLTFFEREHRL